MRPDERDIRDEGRPAESGPAVEQAAQEPTAEAPDQGSQPGDGPADTVGREAEQIEHDLDALLEKAAKSDEYLALAQRVQADFENYRKRAARDIGAAEQRGLSKLAKELLPAIDSLDRALESAGGEAQAGEEPAPPSGETATEQLVSGIRLVRSEIGAALERVGVESYSPAGERFDPNLHEAMAQVPAPDGVESGHVVEVFQDGYRIDGTVIRPARVVVAQ